MLRKADILLLILLLFIGACKKDEQLEVTYEVMSLGENINVHDVAFFNDSLGFASGGRQFVSGAIFRTTDQGNSWKKVYINNLRSIYGLHIVNENEIYAGGDSMLLLVSWDKGENWQEFWFDTIPPHKFQRTAFKKFCFINNNEFYIVGGQNFDAGLVYKTTDAGRNWDFDIFENELSGISFPDPANGFICGNGVIYRTLDGGLSYQLCRIEEDFFTSVHFSDKNNGIAAGYNGGIYMTKDAGNKWNTVISPNKVFEKRNHFNDMKFADENNGYLAGAKGLFMITEDGGESWKTIKEFCSEDLFSISILTNKTILISSENGKIYKIHL
jgi:photosystem II stability/assembly factor-like uncharacterized protein